MANGNGKKSKKKIIILSVILGAVVILGTLIFLGSRRETIVSVQTEKIQRRTITQIVSATGKIQPETQVKINAEVSGEIVELPVREGQGVRKGQLLIRIKPDAYQAQYDRAVAAINVAQSNLDKAEADFRRATELYGKKLLSDADMDVVRATYQNAKATGDQVKASLKEARETLAKTSVFAPMDGLVSQLISQLGERVSGSTFTQGTEIMTIADLSRMEARVDVGENDIVMVSFGDTARVEVDAYPGRKFVGSVTQIANTAKSQGLGTQEQVTNFEVRILLQAPPGVQFRPGMSVTSDIETETRTNVLAVPIQSVTVRVPKKEEKKEQPKEGEAQLVQKKSKVKEEEKLQEVIFVAEEGKVKSVPVKRGISDDSYVEITEGGKEAMDVVSGPFKSINRDLEDGSKVRVDNKKSVQTGAVADKAK